MKPEDKIKEIIKTSGNDLHLRIANFLRAQGWSVNVSPYYNDQATNKPREIDLVALKKYEVRNQFFGNADMAVRLFIECKYIKDPNVIWFEQKDSVKARELAKDNPILRSVDDHELQNTSRIPHKIHHYLFGGEAMKLASGSGKADPLYEGMNGCLNGMIFYKANQYPDVSNTVDFPLILVNGFNNLHRRQPDHPDGHEIIENNFQMEVDYSFTNVRKESETKYFLIDIVSEEKFKDFLDGLEANDISLMQDRIHWDMRQNEMQRDRDDDSFDPYSTI